MKGQLYDITVIKNSITTVNMYLLGMNTTTGKYYDLILVVSLIFIILSFIS